MMKLSNRIWITAVLVGMTALQTASAANISGKVTLKGKPPEELKIRLDPLCGKLNPQGLYTRHFVTGQDNGLKDVFVHITAGLEGKTFEPPKEKPVLDQSNCEYEPYVMGVMVDQPFVIKNSDPLMHNVHATPKNNKGFNFAQVVKGQENEKAFSNPELLVRFKCDVHPWMFAYVSVMEHPFFAVTDKDGNFKLPENLPAGTYTVEAYHRKLGPQGKQSQTITVGEGDSKTLSFVMEVKEE